MVLGVTGRALSAMERALVLLDEAQPFNGLLSFRLRGPLDETALRAGILALQARHPILRMAIEGDAYVERAGAMPLHIVERRSDDDWRIAAENVLNERFVAGELLARMVWVRGDGVSELLTAHHHAIADAHSSLYLAHDLFTGVEAARTGVKWQQPSLPLRPGLSELLPKSVKGLHLFGAMNSFLFRTIGNSARRPQKLTTESEPPFCDRRNRIEHRALPADATTRLAQRCREQNTTVHGALVAALVTAAGEDVGQPATLGCFSAVNLRGDLTEKLDGEVGMFISQLTTFHKSDTPFWPLAREARDAVERTKAAGEQYLTMPNMGMFIPRGSDPGPVLRERLARVSQAAIGVTNLGRLSMQSQYGPLSVEEINVCVGMSVIGRLAAAVGTYQGRLLMNVIFVEPLISVARAARIADRTLALLSQAAA